MLLVAEIITPEADEMFDVIREAESVLVQAVFDDLVRTLPPTNLTTHTVPHDAESQVPSAAGQTPGLAGGREYSVFPWARSPPHNASL
jgi:hypothetical protein